MVARPQRQGDEKPAPMDVRRRREEDYHSYLVRVRGEFLHYNKWLKHYRPANRFYCEDFERWRLQQLAGEEINDDALPLSLQDPVAESQVVPQESSGTAVEEDWEWPQELLGHFGAQKNEVEHPKEEDAGSSPDQDLLETPSRYPESPQKATAINWSERTNFPSTKEVHAASQLARPASAPSLASQSKRLRISGSTASLKPVALDQKAARNQITGLQRAYSSASSSELPKAVAAANRGKFVGRGWKANLASLTSQGQKNSSSSRDSDEGRLAAVMEKLKRRGLRQASGPQASGGADRSAVEQWLKQLAEDYPDEFCQTWTFGSPGASLVPPCKSLEHALSAHDDPGRARISSQLWVLNLHGDPLNPEDWQKRLAWLSASGRLWLGPSEAEGSGPCSLQLGGEIVPDLQVMRARSQDVPELIDGSPVFAIRIEGMAARYLRKKLLASDKEETIQDWIKACLTPVSLKQVSEAETPASRKATGASLATASPTRSSFCMTSPLNTVTTAGDLAPFTPTTPTMRGFQTPKARKLSHPEARKSPSSGSTLRKFRAFSEGIEA
mmetsp:Transcript_39803/g.71581  ORF Transcript_39803/g.71581 Transcript_39803/m.71581 type:complete len:557 (+) Transcript_39803:63-1733(+)